MRRHLLVCIAIGLAMCLSGIGCGPSYSTVEVEVTLDGTPVGEATVTFAPKDTKAGTSAGGQTNASGKATITASGKGGVQHGEYIVTVTKIDNKGFQGTGNPTEDMKRMMDEAKKNSKPGGPGGGPGIPGKPGGGSNTSVGGSSATNLLPAKYSDVANPQFTVTVPTSGIVKLDLKSK